MAQRGNLVASEVWRSGVYPPGSEFYLLSSRSTLAALSGGYLWYCSPTRPACRSSSPHRLGFHMVSSRVHEQCCAQSWPTLCDPMDCRSPGSSVHGLL